MKIRVSELSHRRHFFHGAVREALAAANSVAKIGTQDTNAWERPIRYVVDDNGGNVGLVEFGSEDAIGVVSARSPTRPLDKQQALDAAPADLRSRLQDMCRLPLVNEGMGVSSFLFTVGDSLCEAIDSESVEGGSKELFRRELMPELDWLKEAVEARGYSPEAARVAVEVAARAKIQSPIVDLTEGELRVLIPKGSKHESEALELFLSDGLFGIPSTISTTRQRLST